jgi:uncharacterized protein YijF (DUF1287 family)
VILSGAFASSAALALAAGAATAQPTRDEERLAERLVAAAVERTGHAVRYDGAYRRIPYPGGDVPEDVGVCTDLVVRAYRSGLALDLQRLVHEDMVVAFADYPALWGLRSPDPSIDHRRVPNLETFLRRRGAVLPISSDAGAYRSGDLVTWRLPRNLPHIGIVSDRRTPDGARPLVVHNIGLGPRLEDTLFGFRIVGHFRYLPAPEPDAGAR